MRADTAFNALSAHTIEELFLNDLPVFDCIKAGFVKGDALARHWTSFGCDIVLEANDEPVTIWPRTLYFALVHGVVFLKPLAFYFYGSNTFLTRRSRRACLWFDAHDFRAV